jgi:hypothetical protein
MSSTVLEAWTTQVRYLVIMVLAFARWLSATHQHAIARHWCCIIHLQQFKTVFSDVAMPSASRLHLFVDCSAVLVISFAGLHASSGSAAFTWFMHVLYMCLCS